MSAKDPRAEIIAKAVKDGAFRAELKKAPAAAIAKATGVSVPAGMTVKVVEDSASTVHLVLPADVATLSEADLKKVSGGAGAYTSPNFCHDASTAPLMCMMGGL